MDSLKLTLVITQMKLMKFYIITLVALLNTPMLFAQKIQVLSEDNSPLPYATILNRTHQKAYFTNEEGYINAPFQKGDEIEISFIGHHTLKTKLATSGEEIFKLRKFVVQLENLTVKNCTNWKPASINNLADSGGRPFGGVGYTYKHVGNAMIAVWVDTSFAKQKLKAFSFWLRIDGFLKSDLKRKRNAYKAPWRIWFFEANDTTLLPAAPLTQKYIVWHPTDTGKQKINVDSLQLTIPSNGLWVVLEYLKDDRFKWGRIVASQYSKDSIDSHYGAIVDGIRGQRFPLAFYNLINDEWSFANKTRTYNTFPKIFSSIKFEVVTENCEE